MKKLFIFRHGQTEANINKTRDTNPELTTLGREQAIILGNILKDKDIKYLYSSFLKRANDTAKIVGSVIGIKEIEVFGGLEEIDQGILKNTPKKFTGNMPSNYKELINDVNSDMRYIDGESKFEARTRIYNSVLRIAKQTKYDVIGIASHAMVMRELLGKLKPSDYEPLKNCEVLELDFDKENDNLNIKNRISHECFTN